MPLNGPASRSASVFQQDHYASGFKSVDWFKYFEEFSDIHGGNPVLFGYDRESGQGGYLLFQDGWMYSRCNPSGPEYPPDSHSDALMKIKAYWTTRLLVTRRAYRTTKMSLLDLVRTQQGRSAYIQIARRVVVESEDDDKLVTKTEVGPISFKEEVKALRDLWSDVQLCKSKLNDLRVPESVMSVQFSPAGILTSIEEIENDD